MDPDGAPTAPDDAAEPSDPALVQWLSELRTDDAARSRGRVGALKAQAAEDATVVGVLADLQERDAQVLLTTTTGRRHRGQVLVVGPDAVVLRVAAPRVAGHPARLGGLGPDWWVATPFTGRARPPPPSRFGRILAAAAEPGEWLRISVGGEAFGGEVVAISAEVAVLRLDNGDLTYVNLDAVEEVSLLDGAR